MEKAVGMRGTQGGGLAGAEARVEDQEGRCHDGDAQCGEREG